MKTIIAGSRDSIAFSDICKAIEMADFGITEVVSGTARGADQFGERWADANDVPIKRFPANWKPNGILDKAAGHKRNRQMAEYADCLIAVWDGESKGTKGMIEAAQKKGLFVYVHRVEKASSILSKM